MTDAVDEPQESAIPTETPDKSELVRAPSLVLANTGDGKGKSTAAFGTMLRAVALEWPVAVVQFLKSGDWKTGEEKVARTLGVDWFAAGDGFTWDSADIDESAAKAKGAWALSAELITAGKHKLILLDEVSYAMTWGWIDPTEVANTIKARPDHVNLVLTGRDMASEVIDVADTATEMRSIKHAFDSGIVAKKGIDY